MIESEIRNYLIEHIPEIDIYLFFPEKPSKTYVALERTSGGRQNFLKSAVFAIQSVAPTLKGAAELNERVKEAMDGIAELEIIASCRLNSDYNFTDTVKKQYRYQAVFQINHY